MRTPSLPLVVLVEDKNMEAVVRGVLERPDALGIETIAADVFVYPLHRAGVVKDAHGFLKPLVEQYKYALVLFDHEGCGREREPSSEVQVDVQRRLDGAGWAGRSQVVVLEPELEAWVWSDSPHVPTVLRTTAEELEQVLSGYECTELGKPVRPKEAMEKVLRRSRTPRSSSLYTDLARKVSLRRCQDPAFHLFRDTLRRWFGKTGFG